MIDKKYIQKLAFALAAQKTIFEIYKNRIANGADKTALFNNFVLTAKKNSGLAEALKGVQHDL